MADTLAKIDRDYINRETGGVPSRVGTAWTKRSIETSGLRFDDDVPLPSKSIRFRLMDDDEIIYYGGWLYNDIECVVQQAVLSWAMWDAGATIIEINIENEWVREIG